MIGAILASLWAVPAAAAVVGTLLARLLFGDWTLGVLAGATLGLAVLAWRLLGPNAALGVLGAGLLVMVDRVGFRRGAAHQSEKEKADAERAIERAQRARADADSRDADAGRLRDDDGFRRD